MTTGILEILRQHGATIPAPHVEITFEDVVELEKMIIEPWEMQLINWLIQNLASCRAKIPGMKPTLIQALNACDGVTLDAAIKKLLKDCGENRDICQNLVSALWREGFIKISNGKGSAQARVDLTDSGRHKVMTHKTGATARDLLSEIGDEP